MDRELLGLLAAVLTTTSFVPQALLIIRTGRTEGISLTMYSLFTVGVASWLGYGILLHSWPMILANVVTLCLAGFILGLTARNAWRQRRGATEQTPR